jgi:hypothetical protein
MNDFATDEFINKNIRVRPPLDKKDAENLELRSKDYKDQFSTTAPERLNSTFASMGSKPMWV